MSQVTVSKLLKGLYSGAMAFVGALSVTLTGHQSFSDLTAQQWLITAGFTLGAVGGTFGLAGWSGPAVGTPPPPEK